MLARMERGQVDDCTAELLQVLAGALAAPTDALIQGDPVTVEALEVPLVDGDDELTRYTPEQVAERNWLPYSARKIRELAYARTIFAHRDGGRITFTREDIRRTSELGQISPFVKRAA